MIASVIFGRGGSKGFPGKNTMEIFDKKVMEYPLIACKKSQYIDKMYVSTDSDEIVNISKEYNCINVNRPSNLANDKALLQDAIIHAYKTIKDQNKDLKYLIITLCNTPNITTTSIDKGIEMLNNDLTLDSVVTVSKYDMFSPERARVVDDNGHLQPYVPFKYFNEDVSCDRKSHQDTFFTDQGMTIVRAECLEDISKNLLPFQWMGNNIGYIEQLPGGGDIDFPWQVEAIKWWISQTNEV